MLVEVRVTNPNFSKLGLVKAVKFFSSGNLGLKESKDWVDSLSISGVGRINIDNIEKFKNAVIQLDGVSIDTTNTIRMKKFLSLGLADRSDKIEYYSSLLTTKFYSRPKAPGSLEYDGIQIFFKNILQDLDDSTLDSFIKSIN